ncbi:MAG: SCO family protein [Calditrichaceae bacterium]
MKKFRLFIISFAAVIVLIAVALTVIHKGQESQGKLPILYKLPDFTFIERQGKPFSKNDFKGKISIVDFIFTNCPGPCPFMSSKMAELYQIYANTDKVQFVSISVDPNRDSLSVLKEYADRFGVTDNRWVFLRAPMLEVIDLYENGFKLGGILPVDHSTKFILVDQTATIRGYYDCYDEISMKILKTHIRELVGQL